jgi:hypothetical protein
MLIKLWSKKKLGNEDAKIRKFMRNIPHVAIDFHVLKDDYGLPSEGVNPHRIRSKEVCEEFLHTFHMKTCTHKTH